jgi:hypothetical protein
MRLTGSILALASVAGLLACGGTGDNHDFVGPPSASASVIISDSTSLKADGLSYASLTVEVRDNNQNLELTGGNSVSLATTRGVLSDVKDNNNGRYTATIKSTQTGPATISGAVDGAKIPQDMVITFSTP